MRRFRSEFGGSQPRRPRLVVSLSELASAWTPEKQYAVSVQTEDEKRCVESLAADGVDAVWIAGAGVHSEDVVVLTPEDRTCTVLFRATDQHHALLLTNRCNSYCLMCSQPPTRAADDWLVDEAVEVIRHIARPPAVLGLTGGEPTLLGLRLADVTDAVQAHLPGTYIEILSNARNLADHKFARELLQRVPTQGSTWLVPLYGHADFLHDFVVQAPGAFDETVAGLLNLQQFAHAVQLRVVLIGPVLEQLDSLCQFIARNLPFVREVALMAAEPIGFALANRHLCSVDLTEWSSVLQSGCRTLQRYGIPFLFMNVPLCALPQDLRQYAHRSISDWKNVYAPECERCTARSECAGLFAWHESGWRPARLTPLQSTETIA